MSKILIVDDEKSIRRTLGEFLRADGHEVVEAPDADTALQCLKAAEFDVVVTDIVLPRLTGVELLRRIRATAPDVPVVMMTGDPTVETASESLRLGATDYLFKPITKAAIQRAVANVVRVKALEDTKRRLETENRAYQENLEQKVAERTRDLAASQERYRQLNEQLEERVRQRTAQLEAANQELEAFAYSVSHDLRAPLRAIAGFSNALREDCAGQLGTEGQRHLEHVLEATAHMNQLIEDLLRLSQIGRGELRQEAVDLGVLANAMADDLRQAEPERQVAFVVAPDLVAQGDPGLLEAALQNLLANAWKFTGKRDQARIEVGRTDADGEPAFFVRDDGAGFDVAYAKRLFGAFQRLHRECEFPGTGIGLATVRRIIHRHGGRLWAESAVEHGATFYFTLPATVVESHTP